MAEERIAVVRIVVVDNTAVVEPEGSLWYLGSYSDCCCSEERCFGPYQAFGPAVSSF